MLKKNIKHVLAVVMLASITTFAYAEDAAAPVFDADNYPPQFDSLGDTGITDTPPAQAPAIAQTQAGPAIATIPLSLEQRVARAEQQISNLQHKDLSTKIDTLQTDLQSLRGQVEQLSHQQQKASPVNTAANGDLQALRNQVEQLSQQVLQLQNQLSKAGGNKKLAALPDTIPDDSAQLPASPKPKAKAVTTTVTQATVAAKPKAAKPDADTATIDAPDSAQQPNVAEEQQIYQTAYDLIKAKKYNEAITALQRMLQKYPSGQFAANAHYWLGELYGLLGKNDPSASEFGKVVSDFPDSPKVADAQLKLGLIYSAQFKWSDAKAAFKKVINHYPGTASSRLAAEQLKQIKEAGH